MTRAAISSRQLDEPQAVKGSFYAGLGLFRDKKEGNSYPRKRQECCGKPVKTTPMPQNGGMGYALPLPIGCLWDEKKYGGKAGEKRYARAINDVL